jgi:hypothetical protein
MLPILRSRTSQIIVALLCALVLSRMPGPVYAEDATSSLVKIDDGGALALMMTPNVSPAPCLRSISVALTAVSRFDPSNPSLSNDVILRL